MCTLRRLKSACITKHAYSNILKILPPNFTAEKFTGNVLFDFVNILNARVQEKELNYNFRELGI